MENARQYYGANIEDGTEEMIRRIIREELAAHEERLSNKELRIPRSVPAGGEKIVTLATAKMTFDNELMEQVINVEIQD